MSLSRPTLAVGAALAALLLLLLVPAAWLVANRPPKSAAEQLARARAARDAAATRVAELTATGDPADATRAGRERGRVLLQFARVETLFPGAPEIEPADLDAMRLRDETSTDPATRLALRRAFAERHSTGTLAADRAGKPPGSCATTCESRWRRSRRTTSSPACIRRIRARRRRCSGRRRSSRRSGSSRRRWRRTVG